MTRTFRVLIIVTFAFLASPLTAKGQVADRLYKVGSLGQTSPAAHSPQLTALLGGLRDAGYHEGVNLVMEYR